MKTLLITLTIFAGSLSYANGNNQQVQLNSLLNFGLVEFEADRLEKPAEMIQYGTMKLKKSNITCVERPWMTYAPSGYLMQSVAYLQLKQDFNKVGFSALKHTNKNVQSINPVAMGQQFQVQGLCDEIKEDMEDWPKTIKASFAVHRGLLKRGNDKHGQPLPATHRIESVKIGLPFQAGGVDIVFQSQIYERLAQKKAN